MIADVPPSLDDFAPEQRAAVREILELENKNTEGPPPPPDHPDDDARTAAARAALDRFGAALVGGTAIARCDVLALDSGSVTVRCLTAAPSLGLLAGERGTFALAQPAAHAEILGRHGIAGAAGVVPGRTQTLLLCRKGKAMCVVAGPPRASVGSIETLREPSLDDFEPAMRDAVRELLDGRSPLLRPSILAPGKVAMVRCVAVRSQWWPYRALHAVPDVGIDIDEPLELSDNLAQRVESHYGLLPRDAPRVGEERTLVVWCVQPLGFRLYKRWLLLASPPLPK